MKHDGVEILNRRKKASVGGGQASSFLATLAKKNA